MMQSMLLSGSGRPQIGQWVPSQGGYYAGLLTTGTESFTNLDGAGTIYEIYIAEKSVSQSQGQYKNARSCDGTHTYPGTTTAPNSEWNGYFNTYTSVLSDATSTHPIFQTVQALSITVDGTVFDDWYIPAHREADTVYKNLKQSPWQSTSEGFDGGVTSPLGEIWTSSGDSCSNNGTLTTASKYFPHQSASGSMVYGYYKDDTATIRPVRRVLVSNPDSTPPTVAITSPYNTVANNSTMVISFDLSESSTDFVVGDITVTNGSLSNFTGSGFSYTALFTPVATTGVTATISVASNSFSDAQGNFNQDGNDPDNSIDISIIADPVGQQAYISAGNYQWTAPTDVTSVCVVCVGGGGPGLGGTTNSIPPGGGGGLGWKNNIAVVPGQNYSVVVGGVGGQSYFIDNTTVVGGGGQGTSGGAAGGGYIGDGGGNGGSGSGVWAGGGAGGYSGDGGIGGTSYSVPTAGSGGGGGGGGGQHFPAGGGGGVGIYGQGADGTAAGSNTRNGGGGGSGGTTGGGSSASSSGGYGGSYGGGGGVGSTTYSGGAGTSGAVRIIWGSGRAFPSTNTTDQ